MRVWLIKMLYRSLSPSEQLKAHKYLKSPASNDVLNDICCRIDRNWLRSATCKATPSAVQALLGDSQERSVG